MSERRRWSLEEVAAEFGVDLAEEHIDDTDICEKCHERHPSCHCLLPVDCERGRGMCTACDDARCDAYPGECPEQNR